MTNSLTAANFVRVSPTTKTSWNEVRSLLAYVHRAAYAARRQRLEMATRRRAGGRLVPLALLVSTALSA